MGNKRTIAETLCGEDVSPVSKKSRSDKPESGVLAEDGSKDRRRAEKKEKKSKKRKEIANGETAPASGSNDAPGDGEESDAAKAARKAAKRAKKEAKAAAKQQEAGIVSKDTADSEEQSDKKSKAERKVEKAKKKEEKALKKAAKSDSQVDAPSTETPNTETTTAVQSSVTSLVPSHAPTSDARYVEAAALSALPQAKIDEYLSTNFVTIDDPLPSPPKFRPLIDFAYLPITDEAQRAPFASFKAPTPIQAAAWPALFAGRDMIGVAETGSGKTMAFGVPLIRSIAHGEKEKGVKAVVVSPTRELAQQIHDQLVKLATPAGLRVVVIYGGVPKDQQIKELKRANIIVATPGRLNDLINEGAADLSKVNFMVLDEADRMLDKGFEDDIRKIIGGTPTAGRQTLMFTATWPESVRKLANTFMKSPVKITIGDNPTGELRANTRIEQVVEVVEQHDKQSRLHQLLKQYQSGKNKNDKILVFCLYKKEATRIEGFIRSKGFKVAGIHGDLSQQQRTASLDLFKRGEVPLLVATDVAARGLDIPAVKMVINVTFPLTVEDYVHRIGRTGRAGQTGKAITFFTEHDKALSGALINVLKGANQPVPQELLKFGTTVKKKAHDAYGAFFKDTGDMKQATRITFD